MLLDLGDKLAHLCPNKDFIFLRASVVPQVRYRDRGREAAERKGRGARACSVPLDCLEVTNWV